MRAVLSDYRTHLGRSTRDPGYPGNRVSGTFPQLNLRQWSGIISTWLTQSLLDPTNSGRVTMDKPDEIGDNGPGMDRTSAGLTNVQEETLEQAAELLMLRRDTFRIIDGAGPSVDDQDASSERSAQGRPDR